MIKTLAYIYVFLMELLIVYVYGFRVFGFKKGKLYTLVLSFSLFAVYYVFNQYFVNNIIVNVVINLIITFFIFFHCFNTSVRSAVFHDCMLVALLSASEIISIILITGLFKIDVSEFENESLLFIVVILSKTVYAFVSMMMCSIISKKNEKNDYGKSWYLMLSPFTTTFVVVLIFLISIKYDISGPLGYACLIALVMLFVSDIIVFWVYENMQEQASKLLDYEIVRQKEEIDKNYYEVLDRQNENMHILIHDMKNHLGIIQGLSNDSEITDYISEICNDMAKYTVTGQTGNKTLDIIIGKYITLCEANKVKFTVNSHTENISFMNDFDVTALINNLLDNAFEAAKNAVDPFIEISFYNKDLDSCVVNVVNKSSAVPKESKNALITRKADKDYHGFGTKSIKKITNKYNGSYTWYFDEDKMEFHSTILFPLP